MNFVIEKNIPTNPRMKWPWREMEAGDSFVVPAGDTRAKEKIARNAHTSGARCGLKIRTSAIPTGVRVWCLGKRE